jgi:hypothetical protein
MVEQLVDCEKKVYMVTGYKIVTSGTYIHSFEKSRDIDVLASCPVPIVGVIPASLNPEIGAGRKVESSFTQKIVVEEPLIYAIRYHVVRRPFRLFHSETKAIGLRNAVVHSVADGMYGVHGVEVAEDSNDADELYLSEDNIGANNYEDNDDVSYEDISEEYHRVCYSI